ncbi:hypothetical protein [Agrobacterium fabrum]|uniref:hypothetical protein n=1 Tax=Agrobacterium fabrum TaxID=1176649 RepID=UPI0024761D68|nr:hypothetical protein [Agrobacterium fabrum]MDH6294690.1 hypothetical protein [Agrobacterium fabrum]
MANTTWYGDGLSTVAVGSRTVIGTDTGWLTPVAGMTPIKEGDKYGIHVGRPIVIEKIISDTELLLADDWPGPAQTDAPYKVELTSPTIAAVEAMRRLLASLSNGNLDSLSDITVGTDDIPIGIGPGVFGTINKAALVNGVEFDVQVNTLSDRAAYNTEAQGFKVLVANVGDGRAALYSKKSATSGDWSDPSYITGGKGDEGDPGPAGVNPVGNYSSGSTYAVRDAVLNNGSTWIAKSAVPTGQAPPTLPTTENTYWRLLAQKGTDGAGTGDVVGPAGAVNNRVALFDGTTGKILKDGGVLASDLYASALLQDQKPSGTNGGSSAAGWQTRTLNTEVFDPSGIVTLASNQFTVAVDCDCQFFTPTYHPTGTVVKARIFNVTDSTPVGYSFSGYVKDNVLGVTGDARLLAGKTYRLDMYVGAAQSSTGLGGAVSDGSIEIYSYVKLRRA